jgi:hypothetical protein
MPCEGGLEVEVDQGGRLVPREGGAHDTVIQELEEVISRHTGGLGENGDLGHRLGDDSEQQVVGDLDQPGPVTGSDISHLAPEHLQVWAGSLEGILRAGDDGGEVARGHHFRIATHRGRRAPMSRAPRLSL